MVDQEIPFGGSGLRVGDTAVLREPGRRQVLAGVRVLDPDPPSMRRRGAAARRHADLVAASPARRPTVDVDRAGLAALRLRNKQFEQAAGFIAASLPVGGVPLAGGWQADPSHWATLVDVVVRRAAGDWHTGDMTVETIVRDLGLPDRALIEPLLEAADLTHAAGRLLRPAGQTIPPSVSDAVSALEADLAEGLLVADPARLTGLGLDARELAAATRSGILVALGDGLVAVPGALRVVAGVIAALPQPFSVGEARQALNTSRRIVIPLLEALDRRGITRREPDGRRTLGTLDPERTDEPAGS